MKRKKGEAHRLVADTLARMGGDRTSGEIAREAKLTLSHTGLVLRDLAESGKVQKVRHGVYRPCAPTAHRSIPPQTVEVAQLLRSAALPLRELFEHVQAIERILTGFQPGNAQAQIEIALAGHHVLRAVDWQTGTVRAELPRPMGEESAPAVNAALSGRGRRSQ